MSRPPCLPPNASPDWFEDGLRFRCLGPECGACCSGQSGPGVVWISGEEVERLAEHLDLDVGELRRRYLRRFDGRACLRERANYDCIFYRSDAGCTVYEARPLQCRTYPFWGRLTASRVTWEIEAESCPGIGCGETRVPAEEICRLVRLDQRRQPS